MSSQDFHRFVSIQSEADDQELFAIPVIEAFPEVAVEYAKVVKEPMDLRTIKKRINRYKEIAELQDDLVLMFRNCCIFNEGSEYNAYSM